MQGPRGDRLGAQSLLQRITAAFSWSFTGSVVQTVIRIMVLIVLARLLSPEAFGVVSAALVVVYFTQHLAQMGMGPAIVQRAELQLRHVHTSFTLSIALGILLGAVCWIFAPNAARFFRMPELTAMLRVMSIAVPSCGISLVAEALLIRELKLRRLTAIEVTSYVAGYAVVAIALAIYGLGTWALAFAFVTHMCLKALLLLLLQPHSKRLAIDRQSAKDLVSYGGGQTFATLVNYGALQGDNIIVARWLGPAALGLYGRAYNLMANGVSLFAGVLDRVTFPAMSRIQNEPARLALAYRRGIAITTLGLAPISIFLYVVAPELITVMLGPRWEQVIRPFQILSLGILLRASYKFGGSVNRATGAIYPHAWRQVWYAAAVLTGAWMGHFWGITGVATGVLGALAFNYLMVSSLSLRMTRISWKAFVRAHVPGMLIGGIVWAAATVAVMMLRELGLPPIAVLASALVFAAACAILGLLFCAPLLGPDTMWLLRTISAFRLRHVLDAVQ